MKILTVVGARPQFIKAYPVSRALAAAGLKEYLVHTGQHYDENMSGCFFRELGLSPPDLNLGVGSGTHGTQTAAMIAGIETALVAQKPAWVLVYGDTNSTLAGALAAAKLNIPIAHVEAGLRSFNRRMPEEINRVLTDHVSTLLLCPSRLAAEQLAREGITAGVHVIGDVMADAIHSFSARAEMKPAILHDHGISKGDYLLCTLHRAENVDQIQSIKAFLLELAGLGRPVLIPLHPRTRACLSANDGLPRHPNLHYTEPLGYLDMIQSIRHAHAVLTDSGGIQKEAYWMRVPCVTLREETEWVETLEHGWNQLAGLDISRAKSALSRRPPSTHPELYGDGNTAPRIAALLKAGFTQT